MWPYSRPQADQPSYVPKTNRTTYEELLRFPIYLFFKAARCGNLQKLMRAAERLDKGQGIGVVSGKIKTRNGLTALHHAAASSVNSYQMCIFLINDLKSDVNETDNLGNGPLHGAVVGQNLRTIRYLLEEGADINKINNCGQTALHIAVEIGEMEILQVLMEEGANINANDGNGSPLHVAAVFGNLEALRFLLEHNADPSAISLPYYFTPLMLSIVAESHECMELLLKCGADPNTGSLTITPLGFAASQRQGGILKCLLEYRANPDIEDTLGMTPIEHAAWANFVEGVELLFPVTSRISSVMDWSINGIMRYIASDGAQKQREIRSEMFCRLYKSSGNQAFERKRLYNAVFWYTQAIECDPRDATLFQNRNLCFAHLAAGKAVARFGAPLLKNNRELQVPQ